MKTLGRALRVLGGSGPFARRGPVAVLVVTSAIVVCGACGPATTQATPPAPRPNVTPALQPLPDARLVLVPDGVEAPVTALPLIHVEVVATHAARQLGLGGRQTLAPDRGMLFVYAETRSRTFWMKNCLIGLDIAFLDDDGRILQVATLPPGAGLTGDEVPSVTCGGDVRYVLEVAARGLGRLAVGSGDRVDVRTAIAGVEPE